MAEVVDAQSMADEPATRPASASGDGLPSASDTPAPVVQSTNPAESAPASTEPTSDVVALEGSPSSRSDDTQTMTVAPSASTKAAAGEANSSAGPSPYGTRSRNRTGAPRPNYAEDREIDMELEFHSQAAANAGSQQSANATENSKGPSASTEGARSSISTRRAGAVAHGSNSTRRSPSASGPPKEPIPGTSTFSANPNSHSSSTTTTTKKRKAATLSGAAHTVASTTSSVTGTRRMNGLSSAVNSGRETNMMTFEKSGRQLKNGKLKADDGTTLGLNDHVYLICEPPGEPYYLGRIMEFLHSQNDSSLPIDAIRVNWYYRPRDIQRKVQDTRLVFASMHSDTCPLTSLRGKCQILHRSEFDDLDEYRKNKDSFWYEKMFDRYIHRYYEVIPTSQVINVPAKVKAVLDERWRFVVVETGRGKELTSAVKTCKRCSQYCASNNSVQCAVCHNTYHMNCVRPPLLKKPSRGFAWSCGPCSRAQERKLEARNTPLVGDSGAEGEEEYEEDEDEINTVDTAAVSTPAQSEDQDTTVHRGTADQIAQARQWPYRYLGFHCRVEDALDYDDRIYPRASSRLGPKHQASVIQWPGRPVEYVKPPEIKRKYARGGAQKTQPKLSKETVAALEADKVAREKRPRWVMDAPPGYVARGEDFDNDDPNNTARLLWKSPALDTDEPMEDDTDLLQDRENSINEYMQRAKQLAPIVGVEDCSTNFLDKALNLLFVNDYDHEAALKQLQAVDKYKDLKEPELTKEELRKFEEGVAKYGSELHSITRHVKTVKHADIVRFYYMWKKTDKGNQIWGNFEGRKGKKEAKKAEANASKLVDEVADDYDDSAFDNEKATARKRGFECKFCNTRSSRQWRRAPGINPGQTVASDPNAKINGKDKSAQLFLALCQRCAGLWRKYGIQWENMDEVAKKVAQGGNKAWKRKIDEELLSELYAASDPSNTSTSAGFGSGVGASLYASDHEPPKKRTNASEKDTEPSSGPATVAKRKLVEKATATPPVPERDPPRARPCAVCDQLEPVGNEHLVCRECRLTVHRNCYGVGEGRSATKWVCDMCSNDKSPQVSTSYSCVLCPVRHTDQEFVEPLKHGHKKKNDKDRDKERMDHEKALKDAEFYNKRQIELNRPADPREPLKRTAGNNWIHVVCAIWTPEMKFGNARALEPSEGIGTITSSKFEQVCKICHTNDGACITCHMCHAPVHVGCAQRAGYTLGFDVTPVKSSRRDLVTTVTIGSETGSMTAAVWCKEHTIKTLVHSMDEIVDDTGLNALQLYVQTYKQADLTLTGTVRKANLVNLSTKAISQALNLPANMRRASTTIAVNGNVPSPKIGSDRRASRVSPTSSRVKSEEMDGETDVRSREQDSEQAKQICATCGIDVSPKWWKFESRSMDTSHQPAQSSPTHSSRRLVGAPNGTQTANTTSHSDTRNEKSGDISTPSAVAAAALTAQRPNGTATSAWQCHKCHWKKIREPSPRVAPVVPPAAPPQAPIHPPHIQSAIPSQMSWPPTQRPLHGHGHTPYPSWNHAPLAAGAPLPPHQLNGVVHPPQNMALPSHDPYGGQPPHYQRLPYATSPGSGPHYQPNGGPLHHIGHPPPPHHPTPHTLAPRTVNGTSRSPPMVHHSPVLTNGPPVGREAIQLQHPPPHQGPPPSYSSRASPLTSNERPSTPREQMPTQGSNGNWPNPDGRPVSGASASPSLRNLLS